MKNRLWRAFNFLINLISIGNPNLKKATWGFVWWCFSCCWLVNLLHRKIFSSVGRVRLREWVYCTLHARYALSTIRIFSVVYYFHVISSYTLCGTVLLNVLLFCLLKLSNGFCYYHYNVQRRQRGDETAFKCHYEKQFLFA